VRVDETGDEHDVTAVPASNGTETLRARAAPDRTRTVEETDDLPAADEETAALDEGAGVGDDPAGRE
jgi:hypothetical protein